MRRVVLFCFGVVSCASPDVPRVDGVPEDPGHNPPTLPFQPEPGAATPPNAGGSAPTDDTDDGQRSQSDAGSAAGITPAPSPSDPMGADDVDSADEATTSGADVDLDAGGPERSCEFDGGFDAGEDRDAGSDEGDCRGE